MPWRCALHFSVEHRELVGKIPFICGFFLDNKNFGGVKWRKVGIWYGR
jgi:hypothetical protein